MHLRSGLLAAASLLFVTLVLHPPVPPDTADFMAMVQDMGTMWPIVHAIAAAGLTTLAITGLLYARQAKGVARLAWGLVAGGAGVTIVTAVTEAIRMPGLAAEGDLAAFSDVQTIVNAFSLGFCALGAGIALVAAQQLRHPVARIPKWTARLGIGVATVSATTWFLIQVVGLVVGPIWLVSSILMFAWLFAYALRTRVAAPEVPAHA